jgi:hypothetical protein
MTESIDDDDKEVISGCWNFRIMEIGEGEDAWRSIREVYYNSEGIPIMYSSEPTPIVWEAEFGLEGGKDTIAKMLAAFDKPILRPSDMKGCE